MKPCRRHSWMLGTCLNCGMSRLDRKRELEEQNRQKARRRNLKRTAERRAATN